ncbi:hypothetical protein [Gottfriedia solisilvae]|uniref:Uncharacterized protein n=1 Tax=Gottfriedia solisilvae TaxID=1516104 RepID=A0A8J3AH38_9BACI|nr:hypothetical protein [Gottfriedia solisilvae]GGI13223.1 hypothetical protein GCM10007380_16840 [Gottfriedia solisilvae]
MKNLFHKIIAALISALLFSLLFAPVYMIALYISSIVYIVLGISWSYLVDLLVKVLRINTKYVFQFLMYVVAAIVLDLLANIKDFNPQSALSTLFISVPASLLYFHVLLFVNKYLSKKKNT